MDPIISYGLSLLGVFIFIKSNAIVNQLWPDEDIIN
jgi:hypothetical protein